MSLWECLDCTRVIDGGSVPPSFCHCGAAIGGWRWKAGSPKPSKSKAKKAKRRGWECLNCNQIYLQRGCPDDCSNCCHRKGHEPRWRELRIAGKKKPSRPPAAPQGTRALVYERDGYRCVNCGESDLKKLTLDHIRPKSKGGTNKLSNLQTLCSDCNNLKADIVAPPGATYPPELLAALTQTTPARSEGRRTQSS